MKRELALTNESFDFLKHSGDFLNVILDNITSVVLLLNSNMELQAFNPVMKSIFSSRENEDLLYVKCGEAIGCAYNVEELKDCGKTSQCCDCELREAGLKSYLEDVVVYKEKVVRPFYNRNGLKENKYLQFSTRLFKYKNDKYILMIIDDITPVALDQVKGIVN